MPGGALCASRTRLTPTEAKPRRPVELQKIAPASLFLNFGNMILLLSVKKSKVDEVTAFIRQKMNEYRHLYAFDQDALPGNDIVIYDIPLFHFVRVGKVPDPESDDLTKRTEPA